MFRNQKRTLLIILVVVTFFTYFSSLSNPFIWDDEQFITSNQYVQNFDIAHIFTTNTVAGAGIVSNYYRPLSSLSFALNTKIWQQNAFGFHLTNLSFHILAGIFLFLLLLELGIGEWAVFFISLFFLIHPIQTEAVTYMNSVGDSMYAAFLFASLLLFARRLSSRVKREISSKTIKNPQANTGGRFLTFVRNDKTQAFIILFLFVLSLLSKETALAGVGLYILIFVLHVLSSRAKSRDLISKNHESRVKNHGEISLRHLANRNDMIGIGVIGGIVAVIVVYVALRLTILNFDNTLNFYGAHTEYTRSLAIRLFTFCRVLWVYISLLLWPYPLHMERSVPLVKSIFSPWVLSVLGMLFGLVLAGVWELRKKHTAWILFGLVWFVGMLLPASGIIPINGILYEHWLYVPMVGFLIMGYGILQFQISNFKFLIKPKQPKNTSFPEAANTRYKIQNTLYRGMISFGIVLSILYIVLTIRQNNIWADPITFYSYTLQFAPDSARLHNNLGMSLSSVGDNKDAIVEYKKALALGQDYPQIYNNLGNAQMHIGDYKDAETNLKKALELSPQFEVAKINLLKLYVLTKQMDKAKQLAQGDAYLMDLLNQIKN